MVRGRGRGRERGCSRAKFENNLTRIRTLPKPVSAESVQQLYQVGAAVYVTFKKVSATGRSQFRDNDIDSN